MCDGFSEVALIVGATAAVAGAAVSYSAGQDAAAAAQSAQEQQAASQASAFQSRLAAEQNQLQGQTAVNNASAQRFAANQQATQEAQTTALANRQATITGIQNQQQAASQQADQAVSTGIAAATGTNMADAQASQVAQASAMNAPVVQNVEASNPLGAANTGVTKEAMDAGTAGAKTYVGNYGDSLARLSSYNAPISLANQQATTIGTNLMPAGAADQLIRSGAPALLAPSTQAYQDAGLYGNAVANANAMQTQNGTTLVNTAAANATDLANLQQSDDAARIQGQLSLKQAQAAATAALGSGITAIGNAGVSYGTSSGAFKTPKTTA